MSRPSHVEVLTTAGVFALLCCIWTLLVGKDMSWDVINHHLYLPFSLLSGRYETDLFAANAQSYQNPIGYVPLYLLVDAGLPAWCVGLALSLLHALCVIPLAGLAWRLWPEPTAARLPRMLALALAMLAPIFLLTVGTSSIDPISNLLVLSALAAALCIPATRAAALVSGLLMGLAVGMKPTNAALLAAGGAAVLLRVWTGATRWQDLLLQVGATIVGALAAMGPWSLWLGQTFGNPVYPFFNHWFQSPYAPTESMVDLRFLPKGGAEILTRLLAMAELRSYVHTEVFAPDLRPAALALLGLVAVTVTAVRTRNSRAWRRVLSGEAAALAVFVLVGYGLWVMASGNSRYVIPLFMLTGLLLVKAAETIMPRRAATWLLLLLATVQFTYFWRDGNHRYMPRPWDSRPYLDAEVPERLRHQPFLHLSIGTPSMAGLAPYLARDGAFVNIMGPLSLPTDGPLGLALQTRLKRWEGRTRFLMRDQGVPDSSGADETFRRRADRIVYRFGLAFDWGDCEDILIHLDAPDAPSAQGRPPAPVRLRSCAAKPRQGTDPQYLPELAAAEAVFSIVEAQCPRVFGPRPMATDGDLDAWQRRYLNSNARLMLSNSEGLFLTHFRSAKTVRLGSADEVRAGTSKPACAAWEELDVQ